MASTEVARRNASVTYGNPPRTEYVLVTPKGSASQGTQGASASSGGGGNQPSGRRVRYTGRTGRPTPRGLPGFLGGSRTIVIAWGAAMAIVSWDEWRNNGILPRPQRLWYTSVVYGLLTLMSFSDMLYPLASALAIGYTIVLLWQYYNKSGQFGAGGTLGGASGTTQAPNTTTAGGRG